MMIVLLIFLSIFNATMFHWLDQSPSLHRLDAYTWESASFRALQLGEKAAALSSLDYEALAGQMLAHDFDLTGLADAGEMEAGREKRGLPRAGGAGTILSLPDKSAAYRKLAGAYETIFADLQYFPVPRSTREGTPDVAYEDGWLQKRTYGGERGHEGCDIMGTERERGFYPVVSISGGTIEKLGWLEQGGWRVGIRAPSGLYLYYAHLYSYAPGLKEGKQVRAGELLGYMGDSGYGKQENTVGNFEVHLHVGMYLRTDHYQELSVNPYWVLRWLEKNRLAFNY